MGDCALAINSLPHDMLVEVLARVASSSCTDLCNAKMCCRDFLGAAEEDCIFQHVSMEKIPRIPWKINEEAAFFLKRCKDSGNAEALYRQGMVEFFSHGKEESGIGLLQKAVEKGHMDALYVYGLILLCRGGQSKQEALKLLSSLKGSKPGGFKLSQCRERVKGFICSMWVGNYIERKQEECMCSHANTCKTRRKMRGWPTIDDEEEYEDSECCCRWEHELTLFCKMLGNAR